MWYYRGNPVTSEELEGYKSFVYVITNVATGKKYIGKKRLQFIRKKKIKDSKRKKTFVKESDWETYYGSSESLAKDIASLGKETFRRDILYLCKTNPEATYWELWEQMQRHVLLNHVDYYNNYVGARIHRNHVMKKKMNSWKEFIDLVRELPPAQQQEAFQILKQEIQKEINKEILDRINGVVSPKI